MNQQEAIELLIDITEEFLDDRRDETKNLNLTDRFDREELEEFRKLEGLVTEAIALLRGKEV